MRMRKKKNSEKRLLAAAQFVVERPTLDPSREIYLEIGAGKGGFATEMAKRHGEVDYYALEKVTDCVVLAAERALALAREGSAPSNLHYIIDTADNLIKLFPRCSVSRIFLNFSDPWSKKGYAKRRLTHRRYLALYMNLLKDGGEICFKTDNDELFDFSLSEISAMGLSCSAMTRDLHASEYAEGNVITEYEAAFSAQGKNINMLRLTKPSGFLPELDESLASGRKIYEKRSIPREDTVG